jgi:hypothetical protein
MEKKSPMSRAQKGINHGSSEAHSRLVKDILLALGALGVCRVWRNEVGAFERDGKWTRYGLVGSADILGIVLGGLFIAIECKTGGAKQTDQQRNFEAMIKKMGGHYCVARSVDDALSFIQRVASGCNRHDANDARVGHSSLCP